MTVTLPACVRDRNDLLSAIVWLCQVPPPSLKEAQSHDFYEHSTGYRLAVVALYLSEMSWFDAQTCGSHLLRPTCLRQDRKGRVITACDILH